MRKKVGSAFMYMGSDDDCRRPAKNASTCEWSPSAVSCLLDSYGEKFSVSRGYLKTQDWEEVVSKVNDRCEGTKSTKTMRQCRDKVDSLKKRYRTEKQKAEGASAGQVAWPLFTKLDEMMGSVVKQRRRRAPEALHRGQRTSFADPVPSREENDKLEFSDSPEEDEECAVESTRLNAHCQKFSRQGKAKAQAAEAEEVDGMSEEEEEEEEEVAAEAAAEEEDDDDYNTPSESPRKLSNNRVATQEYDDDCSSDYQKAAQMPGASAQVGGKKRKAKSFHPVQALADAVLGFSEVFARIEIAKMEIFTKMKLEMARLGKRSRKRRASSASSMGSG